MVLHSRRLAAAAFTAVVAAMVTTTAAPATAGDTTTVFARSAYAVFDMHEGVYTVDVGARVDYTHHLASATTRGELDDGLYYFALGSGPGISFTVDGSLRHARLQARLAVVSCFDEAGDDVTDSRCPVGRSISVAATFSGTGDLVHNETDGDVMRGRLGEACTLQDGTDLGPARYAEIVENHTTISR